LEIAVVMDFRTFTTRSKRTPHPSASENLGAANHQIEREQVLKKRAHHS
jgi:hypothetical protein